jgi:hypothetical protein
MPYKIVPKGNGYKVRSIRKIGNPKKFKYYSKKPMSKEKAKAQYRILSKAYETKKNKSVYAARSFIEALDRLKQV